MTEDSSLTDFVGGDDSDGESGEDTESADSDDTASADSDDTATADPESVEPVAPAFTAVPEDESCSRCGATVGIRWRSDDGEDYVCVDCKEW